MNYYFGSCKNKIKSNQCNYVHIYIKISDKSRTQIMKKKQINYLNVAFN